MQAVIDAIKKGEIKGTAALVIASNNECYAIERARRENIPVFVRALKDYKDSKARDTEILKLLKEYKIGLILLAGFLGIVGKGIVDAFPNAIMNIHPALLPAFGGKGFHGLKVHEAVLERGVKVTGATVHFVNDTIDGGMIISQKAVPVLDGDTPETLQKRVMDTAEYIIYPQAVKAFCEDRLIVKDNRVYTKEK